jgi:hypothetical protein
LLTEDEVLVHPKRKAHLMVISIDDVWAKKYALPLDKDKVVLKHRRGSKEISPGSERFKTASMDQKSSSAYRKANWLGCHVHASCWEFIWLTMSSFSAVEKNLDLFIKAAREYHKYSNLPAQIEPRWRLHACNCGETYRGIHDIPLCVPELQTIIQRAITETKHLPLLQNYQHYRALNVLLDIAILIIKQIRKGMKQRGAQSWLDQGFHTQDIQKTLEAFRWRLPDSYWQHQIKLRLCNQNLGFDSEHLSWHAIGDLPKLYCDMFNHLTILP